MQIRRYNWRKIKTGTLGDLRPPMKKAVRTSLRFTRLNEDTYTRSTVYRDNEDLRAKVSRDSRAASACTLTGQSRKTKPEEPPRSDARHVHDPKLFHPLMPQDKYFFYRSSEPLETDINFVARNLNAIKRINIARRDLCTLDIFQHCIVVQI